MRSGPAATSATFRAFAITAAALTCTTAPAPTAAAAIATSAELAIAQPAATYAHIS